jgi:hypothetical protein
MSDDKDIVPLDDLSAMARWIVRHTGEEGAIVITFKEKYIGVGVTGTADKLMYSLNCAIYQVMSDIVKMQNARKIKVK